ncbi:MAG: hypothetical protein K6G23_08735 [Lachnospiraceae bacterium]|nr:hypothetical protein [Lachnospiraceae bacterium]
MMNVKVYRWQKHEFALAFVFLYDKKIKERVMKNVRIKYDFSHGPIWKDVLDLSTGKWSTGISVIDNDMALSVLDEKAEKEYTSSFIYT